MANLSAVEIKAFVPAKDFALSKQFYQDMGFSMASEGGGIAYFHIENCSFLLQDFDVDSFANNFMMHLLVEDVDTWHAHVMENIANQYHQVRVSKIETQPWNMRDFTIHDPSGVLWRVGQNIHDG